jgi:hypothetical protein
MAEEPKTKAAPAGEATADAGKVRKKKLRPTNCAFSNKRIRRKDWYYRDGKYFANKQCYLQWLKQEAEKKAKEAEKTKEAEKAKEAAAQAAAPAAENPAQA